MSAAGGIRADGRARVRRMRVFTSLKAEMLLSIAVMGTAALSIAVLNVMILQSLVAVRHGALYLVLLIIADVIVFVAFGAYKVQGLVIDPLAATVEATEAIAAGDLSRRATAGGTVEFERLSRSINRMTSRLLEEQAQRAHLEKVASVGRLAAGVAHEVGNPLGAIVGYTHLVRTSMSGDAVAAEALSAIERESARIDRIIRGMLDYARPRRRRAESLDVNETVRRALDLLTDQGALRGIDVTLSLDSGLPSLLGDVHELEQVLVNLVLNAVDAMEGKGTLSIVSRSISLADIQMEAEQRWSDGAGFTVTRDQSARLRAWLNSVGEPHGVVKLVVADTGPGIPWDDMERVFDPFFTTKDPGKGTGLGLANVARVVEGLGGMVWARPAREGGAAFISYIPVPAPNAADAGRASDGAGHGNQA